MSRRPRRPAPAACAPAACAPAACALAACALVACSRAALEPTPPPPAPETDHLISIRGRVCGEPPSEEAFPIKVLFVVDQSTSLQCTDSQNRRVRVLSELVNRLSPQPNVWIGFVGFANWSRELPFTQSPEALAPFLDPAQGLGPATDYQGALSTALKLIEEDMLAAGAALRARSRYVVTFISDGAPEPRCRPGCEDDRARCADGVDNDADGLSDSSDPDCEDLDDSSLRPDVLYGVCNTDVEVPDGLYVDLEGRCPGYNQPEQLARRVDDLRALKALYGAGDLTLNTVLLSSPQEVIEAVCGPASASFGYNTDVARELLARLARAGGGAFRDVNLAEEDGGFLDFDYGSLRSVYLLRELYASHPSFISDPAAERGGRVDTDEDGLSDDEERAGAARGAGSDPLAADSDALSDGRVVGDGYGDLFEERFAASGFDPRDPLAPALACEERGDRDGDGLTDCEERFLGSDPLSADTDGDLLVDGDELRAGLDPLKDDGALDDDLDGVTNREELRAGRSPARPEPREGATRMLYEVRDVGEQGVLNEESGALERRQCYDFSVRRAPLSITALPERRGRNRVYLTALSRPLTSAAAPARARRACVEADLPDLSRKRPAEVDVTPAAWQALRDDLYLLVDDISDCEGVEFVQRDRVEALIAECLPPTLDVGRYRLTRAQLVERLYALFDRRMYLNMPLDPANLFVPLALFDPDAHCFSLAAAEEMAEILGALGDACESCAAGERP